MSKKTIDNKVKLLKKNAWRVNIINQCFLEKFTSNIQKQMLTYCCYCKKSTKDINLGPIMTKNRLIINKKKCFSGGFKKSKSYKKVINLKPKL